MSGEIKGAEGDPECCEQLTSELTPDSSRRSPNTKAAENAGENEGNYLPRSSAFSGCITQNADTWECSSFRKGQFPTKPTVGQYCTLARILKRIIIAAIIVVTVLIVVIILLAVKNPETCPLFPAPASQGVACPDFWIGYKRKCFYVSKEERNWSLSLNICSSLNASLAVIDSQKELEFWVGILKPFHHWFGISREVNQDWKWANGTKFKNQFPVRGEGFCAYINGKGADSTICSMEKHFVCSRPENCRTG